MKYILIGLVILLVGGYMYAFNFNDETFNVTVKGKERITEMIDGADNSYYLIYTDKGTFKITDVWLRGVYTASDTYGSLDIGKHYRITVVGYRMGFISSYKKIIKFEDRN